GTQFGLIIVPESIYRIRYIQTHPLVGYKGCYRCGGSRCGTCQYLRPSKDFRGRLNPRRFKIHFYANCGTNNVIYLITCSCGLQYVVKTIRPFRKRLSEHLSCVSCKDSSSAEAKHLIECHQKRCTCLAMSPNEWISPQYAHLEVGKIGLIRSWALGPNDRILTMPNGRSDRGTGLSAAFIGPCQFACGYAYNNLSKVSVSFPVSVVSFIRIWLRNPRLRKVTLALLELHLEKGVMRRCGAIVR
ncbi:hypothetical protein XELAEV_18030137mg, partial [Xenopus laevis]